MKTRVLIKEGEYRLAKSGVMDAKVDSEELFCFMKKWDKVMLFLRKEEEVDKETEAKYLELIERRGSRIPLQHITGVQEFMGYEFKVNQDVLIPRQDTEILVTEAAQRIMKKQKADELKARQGILKLLKNKPKYEVLDLCCGSGAIGISLSKICEDVRVTGADLSGRALVVAADNAKALRTEMEFYKGDMFQALDSHEVITVSSKGVVRKSNGRRGSDKKRNADKARFDMIVSNPPYIKHNTIAVLQEEVKKYEPISALDGGKDGLDFYRTIVDEAAEWLKPGGELLLEIGHDQGEDLRKLIRDKGLYTPAVVIKDLRGRDRVVSCARLD
ncbi:MAG: peptide chain release factor N(5)-glutamine methyltransferase [Bacillota bacterium]|nr:peptide chain release factor N(5)-glutamine methyltransferase [Bacillota bacterium]